MVKKRHLPSLILQVYIAHLKAPKYSVARQNQLNPRAVYYNRNR